MMHVNVLIFGKLRDITGVNSIRLNDVADTNDLIRELNRQFPGLSDMKYLVAVEKEIINGNTSLAENNTVALLPPYAGG
jgi:molybdopterin synthase sulfur carrier subunit